MPQELRLPHPECPTHPPGPQPWPRQERLCLHATASAPLAPPIIEGSTPVGWPVRGLQPLCGCPQGSHWAQSSPSSWGKEVRAVGPLWVRVGMLGRSHISSLHLSVWV